MSAEFSRLAFRSLPVSHMTQDCENWIFAGPTIDPFVTSSPSEAKGHADFLNGESLAYAVVRFNAVEGRCTDATEDFAANPGKLPDEYEDGSYVDRRWVLGRGRM